MSTCIPIPSLFTNCSALSSYTSTLYLPGRKLKMKDDRKNLNSFVSLF